MTGDQCSFYKTVQ
uniref:Uncharacterized protein n=1 Tax=Anguilla anguilla TaxID=7936 RepID=A0A0E9T7P0_ANGAN